MNHDREWMWLEGWRGRRQEAYQKGVREFLDFAFKDTPPNSNAMLKCPCMHCVNFFVQNRSTMKAHLLRHGIDPNYNPWTKHGEEDLVYPMDSQMDEEEEDDDFDNEDFLVSDDLGSEIEMTQAHRESSSNSTTSPTQSAESGYIQLWLKTKTHKDGKLDEEAETILEKFRELHLKTIEEKGIDDLTIEDAYEMVLGHSSGHARGLGRGHSVPSKKENIGRLQLQHELQQFHQREEEARERERELRADFERKELQLRAEMAENEREARERERATG